MVISNCVINLSLDKDKVLAEAFRVLRPGGRFAVSDVVFQGDMSLVPDELLRDVEAWSGCIAGALEESDYLERLRRAGFADAAVEVTNVYDGAPGELVLRRARAAGRRPAHQRVRARGEARRLRQGRVSRSRDGLPGGSSPRQAVLASAVPVPASQRRSLRDAAAPGNI